MTRLELDQNLKQAVEFGVPVEIVDPSSDAVYYLISAEQFQNISGQLSGDIDPREGYPLLEKVMADDDANDPLLDSYQ